MGFPGNYLGGNIKTFPAFRFQIQRSPLFYLAVQFYEQLL